MTKSVRYDERRTYLYVAVKCDAVKRGVEIVTRNDHSYFLLESVIRYVELNFTTAEGAGDRGSR